MILNGSRLVSRGVPVREIYALVKEPQRGIYQATGNIKSYEEKGFISERYDKPVAYDTSFVKPRRTQYDSLRRCECKPVK